MNYGMSVIFRIIPLAMGAVCLGFGYYVRAAGYGESEIASNVLLSLTAICIALFSTAATIIRQLIGKFNKADRYAYPILGYAVGICTIFAGAWLFLSGKNQEEIVSGNIVFGVGLIACCVATVAISSGKFILIPHNSENLSYGDKQPNGYSRKTYYAYFSIPVIAALIGTIRGYMLITNGTSEGFVAGHVEIGIGLVCASLIALVGTVLRQIQNKFKQKERWLWSAFVLTMGTICVFWGADVMIIYGTSAAAPGFVLIGLGMVCYSISSKVILLGSVWRRNEPLAKRIPLIPITTALTCLFLSAFLFERSYTDTNFFVPSHVVVGLGAVCFTLYAIVSILESGTSKSSS